MSIRSVSVCLLVAFLAIYAWKDWFKSLCGLILLMAVIQHVDMPKTMFGIQGLNPWNVLFLAIFLAWLVSRRHEGLMWDMPRHIKVLLLIYLGVILVGVIRTAFNSGNLEGETLTHLISERLINTVKWVLPGILLYDGCRNHRRLATVLVCLLAMYFLIGVQVVKRLPLNAVFSGAGIEQSRGTCEDIGYGPVDMSVLLAGAFWGIVATLQLVRHKKRLVMLLLAAAGVVAFGLAQTGGRAGYLAWMAIGLVLCLLKWRRYLILAPVVVILLPIVFPGVVERMFKGIAGQPDVPGQTSVDAYAATAGRNVAWPYVIDKISESPWVGHGRLAMSLTGIESRLANELGERFGHPHNMYFETLLDNGIIGSIPLLLFWVVMVVYSGRLFTSNDRSSSAVGGVALSLILAQLVAGVGSQHFYPEESTLGMWAAMFLSLRICVEQAQIRRNVMAAESSWNTQLLEQQQVAVASGYAHAITA